MNKSINLLGLSTNPSDYNCEDGNLSTALNVYHDFGDVSPVEQTSPKLLANLGNDTALYIHENGGYKHIIGKIVDKTSGQPDLIRYAWCIDSEIEDGFGRGNDTVSFTISCSPSFKLKYGTTQLSVNDGSSITNDLFVTYPTAEYFEIVPNIGLKINGKDPSEFADDFQFVDVKKLLDRKSSDFYIYKNGDGGSYHYVYTFMFLGKKYVIAFGFLYNPSHVYYSVSNDIKSPESSSTNTVNASSSSRVDMDDDADGSASKGGGTSSVETPDTGQNTELEAQIAELTSQKTQLEADKAKLESEKAALKSEKDALEAQVEALQEAAEASDSQLQQQISQSSTDNVSLLVTNSRLNADISTLQSRVTELNATITEKNTKVTELNAKINEQVTTIAELNDRIAELEEEQEPLEMDLQVDEDAYAITTTSVTLRVTSDADIYRSPVPELGGSCTWTKITAGNVVFAIGSYYLKSTTNDTTHYAKVSVKAATAKTYTQPNEKSEFPYSESGYPYNISRTISNIFTELNGKDVKQVVSVKNILEFICSDKVYYYLWNKSENYKFLGNRLPELKMSFALEGHTYQNHGDGTNDGGAYDAFNKHIKTYYEGIEDNPFTKIYRNGIDDDNENSRQGIDAMLGELNSFCKRTSNDGYFSQPFLVRFAYRMFDESVAMASNPMLMNVSLGVNPILITYVKILTKDYDMIGSFGVAAKLKYILDNIDLSDWTDIIKGVDIFISAPIYTYKQDDCKFLGMTNNVYDDENKILVVGSECKSLFNVEDGESFFTNNTKDCVDRIFTKYGLQGKIATGDYLKLTEGIITYLEDSDENIIYYKSSNLNNRWLINNGYYSEAFKYKVDAKSSETIEEEIRSTSAFYLLSHIKTENLVFDENGADIKIPEGYLNTITSREVLVEDYDSYHNIVPKNAVVYNGRLSSFGITKDYFKGFNYDSMAQHDCNTSLAKSKVMVATHIKDNNVDIVKCTISNREYNIPLRPAFLFYPDANAKTMDVYYVHDGKVKYIQFALDNHPFINGCYCYTVNGSPTPIDTSYTSLENAKSKLEYGNTQLITNEVRTSEVNNPFVVLAKNVESVGNGKIISLVPQATALSQGQFGEFPMMAFTTDGIWALYVNDTGGWSAKQPFSRDVVLNEDAGNILQLDKSVIFATTRGLMIASGSDVECISDVLDGKESDFTVYRGSSSNVTGKNLSFSSLIPITDILEYRTEASVNKLNCDFKEFIGNAVLLYDYANQRIIIGNPNKSFSYVYNIKDKLWTTICQCITSSVNSYPNCYAMTKVNSTSSSTSNLLIDFSSKGDDPGSVYLPSDGLIITRPIKLGAPDSMKTISKIIVRGKFNAQHTGIALLGSRDLSNWVVVGSANGNKLTLHHGTPYKYFRVAVICKLVENESVSSLDIEYDIKQDNKIR